MTYTESKSSQLPALLLLGNLRWSYLPMAEVERLRGGNLRSVLLAPILRDWLSRHNSIRYHGQTHPFSESNIREAMHELERLDFVQGAVKTNEDVFDLLMLGKSLEQTIAGDRRSFSLRYIDWQQPENNVYHYTAEFPVLREGSAQTYRPDIVLFVNGIPLAVIENKRPDLGSRSASPVAQAISQHLRNQDLQEGIPRLFAYAQLLLAADGNELRYGVTGTPPRFWSAWKEKYPTEAARAEDERRLMALKNQRRPQTWTAVFGEEPFRRAEAAFLQQYDGELLPTGQDRGIYYLLQPQRLLELIYVFTLYDAGVKKIARYQQYFAVKRTLDRVRSLEQGRRAGGVIWHTQGSGKSLTMVMLAKALALEPGIPNPRVVIVTDRIDLDQQITRTFRACGKTVHQARSGADLERLLRERKAEIITTIVHKFAKSRETHYRDPSADVFVLVDESHRSQYGEANVAMRQVLPNACYIAFTGTPLLKREKSTARKFGGYIDKYTIDQAVQDGAVLPLLYEGRQIPLEVNKGPIDNYFRLITSDLSEEQKRDLKKRFARADQLRESEQMLWMIAFDVSQHYARHWQGTGFKAQLTAPSKAAAIKLQQYFEQIGKVSAAVVISPPDTREGTTQAQFESDDAVQRFWKAMMKRHGSEKKYQDDLIRQFKGEGEPEILIVVDKLLTGFDAPRNRVLYLARSLREHNLLQAIARVNRLYEGKEHGYIIDYYGLLGELDQALTSYSSLEGFEEEDVQGALTAMKDEIGRLPQVHSRLWDLFREVGNKQDREAMERHLQDRDRRDTFYELQSQFARLLRLAKSSLQWTEQTDPARQAAYADDLRYFTDMRQSVQQRYSDAISYGAYAPQIQKLLDQHVSAGEAQVRIELVDISDKEAFEEALEAMDSPRARADTIISRTAKYISEHMDEDPVLYKKLSSMLQEIADELDRRWEELSEEARRKYVERIRDVMGRARERKETGLDDVVGQDPFNLAVFHLLKEQVGRNTVDGVGEDLPVEPISELTTAIAGIVRENLLVDWKKRYDVQGKMKQEIDDLLYDRSRKEYLFRNLDASYVVEEVVRLAQLNL